METDAKPDARSQPTACPSAQALMEMPLPTASLHPSLVTETWLDPYPGFWGPPSPSDPCPAAVCRLLVSATDSGRAITLLFDPWAGRWWHSG